MKVLLIAGLLGAFAVSAPAPLLAQPQALRAWASSPPRGVLPGTFTLTALGSVLKAHWDASELAATPVSTWTDDVSSIALTASTTARPAWSATGLKGFNGLTRPAITCDGVANALVATSFAALPTGSAEGELWALVDQTNTTGLASVLVRYGGATAGTNKGVQRATGGGLIATDGVGANSGSLDPTVTLFNGAGPAGGTFTNATFTAHLNGVASADHTNSTNPMVTGTTRLRVCANNGTSAANFFTGIVSDVFVTTALSTTQRSQLEGWLAWRGGAAGRLPYTQPFRFRQP